MAEWPKESSGREDLSYLWSRLDSNWCVLKDGDRCYVYNKQGHMLIIEDDEQKRIVCQRMIDAGCDVITDIPRQTI